MSTTPSDPCTVVCYTAHPVPFWRLPEPQMRRLEQAMPACRWIFPDSESALLSCIAGADVYFGWAMPLSAWQRAERLRWIHTPQVGTGRIRRLPGIDRVRLTNSAVLDREPVPQLALSLFLSLVFGIPDAVRLQGRKQWRPDVFARRIQEGSHRLLSELTVTIVGAGGIGKPLADLVRPMVRRVQVVRRRTTMPGVDPVYGISEWPRFLPETDALLLAIPVDDDTKGFVNQQRIASFRRPAYIVNVGRGGLVVTSDVVTALESGRLAGYAADVASPEPLPEDSPLWWAPRTLLTPHIGAMRPDFWERHVGLFLSLLADFRKTGYLPPPYR